MSDHNDSHTDSGEGSNITNESEGELMHTCSLSNAIKSEFLNEETSDAILIVENQRFCVHKIILAARSKYFKALFYGNMKEAKQTEIILREILAEPFQLFLEFVYSSQINLEILKEEVIMEVLELARHYGIEDLEKGIYDYIKDILSIDNICIIVNKVQMFHMSSIIDDCANFVDNNARNILRNKYFLTLSLVSLVNIVARDTFYAEEIVIFRSVRKWIEHNKPGNTENILCHVRLPLINVAYVVKEVRASNLFSEASLLSAIDTNLFAKYEELKYRRCQVVGENLASEKYAAKVISGEMPHFLLNGNCTDYNEDTGYTWHVIKDNLGITIELGKPYVINTIKMLISDLNDKCCSYYIDISVDGKKWFCIIDNQKHLCKSWQTLNFASKVAKFIRIVGTHSSDDKDKFCLITFECEYIENYERQQ